MTKEERLAKVSEAKQRKFAESIKHVDLDDLKRMYLDENKSYSYIREYYNLTEYTLDRILRENNLKKSKKQSAVIALESKYRKAGSKEAYHKQVYEKTCQNILAKGITLEEHYAQVSEKCHEAWISKSPEEVESLAARLRETYLDVPERLAYAKIRRKETNLDKYGVDNAYKLAKYTSNSKPNKYFSGLFDSAKIKYDSEVYLPSKTEPGKGYRYDFRVGNTLLEINPWPFHNVTWSPLPETSIVNRQYHALKTKLAREYNYRCVHVWDWDSPEKVLQQLCSRTKIYARKCEVRELTKAETDYFLNAYHFQSTCRGQIYRYGLYLNDILVQVITFGKPRYNNKYEYELLRLCTSPSYYIVGGAERLFQHFGKEVNPTSIISYCDNAKFTGDVYLRLGMTLIDSGMPAKHWYSSSLNRHVTDNLLKQRGFDQLFGDTFGTFGKGTDNSQLMKDHGFVEIYDCGQSTYIWLNERKD